MKKTRKKFRDDVLSYVDKYSEYMQKNPEETLKKLLKLPDYNKISMEDFKDCILDNYNLPGPEEKLVAIYCWNSSLGITRDDVMYPSTLEKYKKTKDPDIEFNDRLTYFQYGVQRVYLILHPDMAYLSYITRGEGCSYGEKIMEAMRRDKYFNVPFEIKPREIIQPQIQVILSKGSEPEKVTEPEDDIQEPEEEMGTEKMLKTILKNQNRLIKNLPTEMEEDKKKMENEIKRLETENQRLKDKVKSMYSQNEIEGLQAKLAEYIELYKNSSEINMLNYHRVDYLEKVCRYFLSDTYSRGNRSDKLKCKCIKKEMNIMYSEMVMFNHYYQFFKYASKDLKFSEDFYSCIKKFSTFNRSFDEKEGLSLTEKDNNKILETYRTVYPYPGRRMDQQIS